MLLAKPLETPTYLNQDHEHAEGLKAAYLFNDLGGKVFDWTQNQNDLSITDASWVADGYSSSANTKYCEVSNANDKLINSDEGSIIFWLKSYSVFNDSFFRFFLHAFDGVQIYIRKTTANRLEFTLYNLTTVRTIGILANSFPNWTTRYTMITIQWRKSSDIFDNKKMAYNVDGEYKVPDYALNATTLDTFDIPDALTLFQHATLKSYFANAIFSQLRFYSKVLSESTLKSIYQDPYSMFYNPSNIFLSLLGSYKSGLKIKQNYYGANAFPIGRGL